MGTLVLSQIERAIREAWGADTATPENRARWSAANPAYDQCGVTALVVCDLLGGDLIRGEVERDGVWVDYHWWNLLGPGIEVDLTREQFVDGQTVFGRTVIARPPDDELHRLREEYHLLRERVRDRLGL